MKIFTSKKDSISLIVISIIFSVVLCVGAIYISNEYFKTHAYFYDPVGDYSRTIPFYERMQEEADLNPIASRLNFAKLWFQADPKSPFLYIPTILLYPKLLKTPWAMMPAMFFALTTLFYILGYSMRVRSQSYLAIISILLLFASAQFMFNPERGIAAGWLDLPASFLLTSGIIAFLNWRDFQNTYWLILSAIFIAFASMSRSTIIIYAAIVLFVPIIITFVEQKKAFLKPLGLYILIITILIMPFYYYSFEFNYRYYTSLNSGMADSVSSSITLFLQTFSLIGIGFMIVFILLLVLLMYVNRKTLVHQSKYTIGIYVWIVCILPIVWIFIQKTGNTYHVYLTLYALLFVLFIGISQYSKQFVPSIISYSVIIISGIVMYFSYSQYIKLAQNPTPEATDSKQLYKTIATHVSQLQQHETWSAYFDDDVTRIANVEAYKQYGVYPKKYAQGILYFHNSYWKAQYGDMTDDEIADSLVKLLPQNAFVVIPHSHNSIDSIVPPQYTTTRTVLHAALQYVKDNDWEKRDSMRTKKYNTLFVMYNRNYK